MRVTERTVRRWRRAWCEGGAAALKSKGPSPASGCRCGSGSGWRRS
ncbi:helix-turn-helix domain-containing protein [Streptomyces griseoruber]